MMTAWMHEQTPCCHCMVVSIGSDAQLWVSEMSEQTSSSLEEVWLGHDDSMDEHDQTLLQSHNGFDWQRCPRCMPKQMPSHVQGVDTAA